MAMDEQKLVALKAKFKQLDADGDGTLTYKDMLALLRQGSPDFDENDLKVVFEKVDKDRSGSVNFEEFVNYLGGAKKTFGAGRNRDYSTELQQIKDKLPCDRSAESKAKRKKVFNGMDVNGNNILSLAEIDKGIRAELQIGDIGPSGLAPVLMRAYQVARNYGSGVDMTKITGMKGALILKRATIYESTVSRKEFRILLEYLQKYFILYQVFLEVDKNFDGRVAAPEFKNANLAAKGFVDAKFDDVDVDNGGFVLFDEFAAYMIANGGLDMEEDD